MAADKNIIDIVNETMACYQRSDLSDSDEQIYVNKAAKHFNRVAEALLIAVEALEDSANMPEYDQDDAHRLRDKSKRAFDRIRSLS
jgi:hypothetical protein